MEYGEVEVEEVKQEFGWFEASTLVRDFPIGKFGLGMAENEYS